MITKRNNNPQMALKQASNSQAKQVRYAPVAKSTTLRTLKPSITTLPSGAVRVRHSEYIGEVFGSVNFGIAKYVIQPGFVSTFPWLALMAPLYERYRVHRMQFSFVTEKSTSTDGTVMLAVDFDAQDVEPSNKTALLSYSNAVRTQPWADVTYTCNVSDAQIFKDRYIRTAAVASSDIKTFDIGNFFIATQGCADTSVLGELHVSYDLEFRTPQLDLGVFASSGSNASTGSTGITTALILGTVPVLNLAGSGMNISYNTTTGAITCNQVGTYLMTLSINATSIAAALASSTGTGGSSGVLIGQAGTSGAASFSFSLRIKNATDTLIFTLPALTSPTGAVMRIASYPAGL